MVSLERATHGVILFVQVTQLHQYLPLSYHPDSFRVFLLVPEPEIKYHTVGAR